MDLTFRRTENELIEVVKQRQKKKANQKLCLNVSIATTLWMRHMFAPKKGSQVKGPFVVLSITVPDVTHHAFPLMMCVSPDPANAKNPPWPSAWNLSPPPTWTTIKVGEWVGLPTGGDTRPLVRSSLKAREQEVSAGIQERCADISQHGENHDFMESLDYFTTLRVKHAYLCWHQGSS